MSYLNTKPLVYGFEKGLMVDQMELSFEYPSKIAAQLVNNEIDVGLVPVASLSALKDYQVISDYCIGTAGEVASVCLFSDVPLKEIKTILLDYQSRTSVALIKILLREHWQINPAIIISSEGYERNIQGTTAGLVIGDRAFAQRKKSAFIYDLGSAWKDMTGLPFVFAAWVAVVKLDETFVADFNKVITDGLSHIPEISAAIDFPEYDLLTYYTQNIDYRLDASKRKAMELFLEKMNNMEIIS